MIAFSAKLQLHTLFILDDQGRITGTRELDPKRGPVFSLIRSSTDCAWGVRADVGVELAARIDRVARDEPPIDDVRREPVHAESYVSLLGGRVETGPAFTFPERITPPAGVVLIEDLAPLTRHLRGWTADEIPDCSPIFGILEDGHAVSVCFCARRSPSAAEAGVATAEPFRGRGLAPRVTAAWALAVRRTGRLPLYSTSWGNRASLGVAGKLGLEACASDWSVYD